MNQSKLDWAHAWLGGVADKPSDDAKFIEQLKQELPVLPFLGLPFAEDMIAKQLGMKVFLLTDCLINKHDEDISVYPNGGFEDLSRFFDALNASSEKS